jgi:ferritin-like protein
VFGVKIVMDDVVNRITEFDSRLPHRMPDTVILPGVVRQYLYEQGYETEAQVIQLVKDICQKDS